MIEEILEADHREIDRLLASVFVALDAADLETTYRTLDLFWARLAMHIRAEHLRLFPAVRNIPKENICNTLNDRLASLRADHDFFMVELARAIKSLRLAFHFGNESETFAIVRDILHHVHLRLIEHNEIEEKELYPLASELFLSPLQIDDVAAGIRKELDKYPARFAGQNHAN